jgi:hypothetical protein
MFMLDASARNMSRAMAFEYGNKLYIGEQYWEVTNVNDPAFIKQFNSEPEAQDWVNKKTGGQQIVVGQNPYAIVGKNKPLIEEVPKSKLLNIVGTQKNIIWAVKRGDKTVRTFPTKDEATEWVTQKNGMIVQNGQVMSAAQQALIGQVRNTYTLEKRQNTVVRFGEMKDFGILSFRRKGKPVYITTKDVDLFNALAEIDTQQFNNVFMKVAGWLKHLLTFGITRSPVFALYNIIRDTAHSSVIDKDFIIGYDSIKGFVKALRQDADAREFAASGWAFGSSYVKSNSPEAQSKYLKKIINIEGEGALNYIINTPQKLWNLYEKILEAAENGTRIGLYVKKKSKGTSQFDAGFTGRDLMDFSMHGQSATVQSAIRVLPFLNARIQGLYKLGRSVSPNNPDIKLIAFKAMLYTGAALTLWFLFKDDDRYKELNDWEKWNFHHFWIGNTHIRIPKAFEVGQLFASLPEVIGNIINKEEEGKYFWAWLGHTLVSTFAVDPRSQVFKVPSEILSNTNTFTGRDIIPADLQDVEPFYQFDDRTSYTAREFAKQLNRLHPKINISPIHFDYVVNGYTGRLGMITLAATDVFVKSLWDYPDKPANENPQLSFNIVNPKQKSSKYGTEFYKLSRETNTLYTTLRQLYTDKAKDIFSEIPNRQPNESKAAYNARIKKVVEQLDLTPAILEYVKARQDAIFGDTDLTKIDDEDIVVSALANLKVRKKALDKARKILADKNKEIREVMQTRKLNAKEKEIELERLREEKKELAKELFNIIREQRHKGSSKP